MPKIGANNVEEALSFFSRGLVIDVKGKYKEDRLFLLFCMKQQDPIQAFIYIINHVRGSVLLCGGSNFSDLIASSSAVPKTM